MKSILAKIALCAVLAASVGTASVSAQSLTAKCQCGSDCKCPTCDCAQ